MFDAVEIVDQYTNMVERLTLFKRQMAAIAVGSGINREIVRLTADMDCVAARCNWALPANMPPEQIDQHLGCLFGITDRQVHMLDACVRHILILFIQKMG